MGETSDNVSSQTRREARHRARAAHYLTQGHTTEAAITLESLLAMQPTDHAARLQLALLRLRANRYRDAHALTLAVPMVPVDHTIVHTQLAALRAFCEHERMHALANALDDVSPLTLQQLADGAQDLLASGAIDLADRWLRAARERAPDDAAVLVRSALHAIDLGRFDHADAWLERAIALHDVPMAHWLLAGIRTWSNDAHHVGRLREALARCTDARAAGYLGFALHKELDDLGDHTAAWTALSRACVAWRSTVSYDRAATERLFERLTSLAMPTAHDIGDGDHIPGPTPIIIVGLHRSGTTLLERMLGAHRGVQTGGETMRFAAQLRFAADHHCPSVVDDTILARAGGFDWADIGRRFVSTGRFAEGTHWFTEKQPGNALVLPFLRRALPHARIVLLRRDPMQVGWSMLRELFVGTCPYSYDMAELGHRIARQDRLMSHWLARDDGSVLTVDYEDLVRRPEATARRVFAHCGLDWHDDATRIETRDGRVATASAAQAREPVHTRSLDRWRPYAQHLEPLRAALDDGA